MQIVRVDAAFIKIANNVTEILIKDYVNVKVEQKEIVDDEQVKEIYEALIPLIESRISEGETWALQMLYEGRCWYISPTEDGVELGYYELNSFEGWNYLLR